ncbi:MAG: LytTR family DNA-binding domain-containing protein [Bacteroidia bacterium]|nr:LytTR family DNA-binding domain-containing protein [Bacteroidia bacterium]
MKILIVEDEKLARDYLIDLLKKLTIDTTIVGQVDSVKEAIKYLLKNPEPELIFMDINLGDGLCFEIFEVIQLKCPVIFTTAYDEYAIQAFKVNSIDYLLKPIDISDMEQAFSKFESILNYHAHEVDYSKLNQSLTDDDYKQRFIVKIGDNLKTIPTTDILFFNSENKSTYLTSNEGRRYMIDYSLDKLKDLLDPADYFRINRRYIINYSAITDMIAFSNSRLKISLQQSKDEDIIVARDRVQAFKLWLDK